MRRKQHEREQHFYNFESLVTASAYHIFSFSINTLSDLGDLNNLIGSLSRTIQQYSPPNEWIMCELGVFPNFLENDLLKVDKILGLTFFFKARKASKDSKRRFSIQSRWILALGIFTSPLRDSENYSHFSRWFQRIIVSYTKLPQIWQPTKLAGQNSSGLMFCYIRNYRN